MLPLGVGDSVIVRFMSGWKAGTVVGISEGAMVTEVRVDIRDDRHIRQLLVPIYDVRRNDV